MGADYSHIKWVSSSDVHYGPGEDLSNGIIDLHGKRSSNDTYRDVGVSIMRYSSASGAYSSHKKGILTDLSSGSLLPGVDSFNGLTVYQVETGSPFVMQVTLENNGEKDVETPSVGIYLSTNNVISIADQQLSIYETSLTRNTPLETTYTVVLPSGTTPGDYFLGVFIDPNDEIVEYSGGTVGNNATYYPIRVVAGSATTYTVTPSAGSGGSLSPDAAQTVVDNSTTSFTVTANSGYEIDTIGGTCGGTLSGSTYTTAAITSDCTVTASFSELPPTTYTVSPSAGSGGSISPSTAQTVVENSTTSFTVTANSGYEVDTVGGTCGGSLSGSTYTTAAITSDCTVTASFSELPPTTYTVTPSAGSGGSISPDTAQTVVENSTTSFTVTANSGYEVDTVGGTCGGSLSGSTYTTAAITSDCTVTASFSELPPTTYTVTPSAGSGGSISPDTAQTVVENSTTTFTVTANSGYEVDTVGGTCGGSLSGSTYTTAAITSDCTVTASFSQISYIVTPSAGLGGSISPDTAQTVLLNATTSFTVNADNGYEIDTVSGSCGGSLSGATYTTAAITSDCTVVASFVVLTRIQMVYLTARIIAQQLQTPIRLIKTVMALEMCVMPLFTIQKRQPIQTVMVGATILRLRRPLVPPMRLICRDFPERRSTF